MPLDGIPGSPQDWLTRARGNLARARAPRPPEVLWEDMSFDAQQAAEKAVKAVLLFKGVHFRYVHDLEELLSAASNAGIPLPENPQEVAGLTSYACELRYPGNYEAATEDDHRRAVEIAARVMAWAENIIGGK